MAKAFGAYVHLKVAETQAQLQEKINEKFANTKLVIPTIDISPALTNLQTQLQSTLSQISRNLNVDITAVQSAGSSGTSEQTAAAEERAANAAERRAAANSSSAQSSAENATTEQQSAVAAEQRLQYNEQNHSITVETSDLNKAETDRLTGQLRLLSQIVQMRSTLTGMLDGGIVSSDGNNNVSGLLNLLNQLQSSILANLTPTKAEFASFEAQVTAAQTAMKLLNEELIEAGNIGSATTQTERFATLEKKLITLRAQIQRTLSANGNLNGTTTGSSMQAMIGQIDSYITRLHNMGTISDSTYKEMNAEISRMSLGFKTMQSNMIEAGDTGNSMITRLVNGFKKFGGWMIVTRVLTSIIRLCRQVVTNVKDIDTAMTQLRIVTKASSSDITKAMTNIAKSAKEAGASMTDLIDSATTYARLGYSLDESSSLAKYTSMLQTVGDIDVSDAQDAITAITKAFNIDIDDIESVMDKLVEVGNNFPISVSQIAEGLNNASSALAGAGNTFEQSVAMLTAANTTVDYCRAA